MTGFDGADHLAGVPTMRDAIDTAAYARRVDADYAAAREAGIACVREAIDWRRAERGDAYDFETLRVRIATARRAGVQIAWTLCHSSWPDDVDFASPATVERFARFARAAAVAPLHTPVNEISFLAWALAETSLFGPPREELRERAPQLQRALVQAALAACDAILAVDPRALWMREFGRELCEALESAIPVISACLCRVAEPPAWEDPRLWRGRRLWDALLRNDVSPVVDSAYAQALRDVQARVDPLLAPANRRHSS